MSFKICSIGCGGMAVSAHGPALRKYAFLNPDSRLAACCDMDAGKAEFFQKEFGFDKYYTDMYHMLSEEKPNAVSLVVPVQATAALAVDIIKLGYPLILEKPPGINAEETARIIAAAKKYKTVNRVAFNRRYMPLVEKYKEALSPLLQNGELQHLSCEFFRIGRRDPDFSTTAIHGIDLVRYLTGSDYAHIRFRYGELPHFGPGVANIFMDCTMKSGVTAQLSFCPVAGMVVERFCAVTAKQMLQLQIPVAGSFDLPGRIVVIEDNRMVSQISGQDMPEANELFEMGGFYQENASFFDAVKKGRIPSGDVKSAAQSVEAAQCIRYRQNEYRA